MDSGTRKRDEEELSDSDSNDGGAEIFKTKYSDVPAVALALPALDLSGGVSRSGSEEPKYRLRLTQQQVHYVSTVTNEKGEKEQEGVVQAGSAARAFTLQAQVLDADMRPTAAFDNYPFIATLVFEHDLTEVPSGDASLSSSLGGKTKVHPLRGVLTFVLEVLSLGRRVKKVGRRNQRFRVRIEPKNAIAKNTNPELMLHTLPFSTHSRVLNLVQQQARRGGEKDNEKEAPDPAVSRNSSAGNEGNPVKKFRPSPVVVPARQHPPNTQPPPSQSSSSQPLPPSGPAMSPFGQVMFGGFPAVYGPPVSPLYASLAPQGSPQARFSPFPSPMMGGGMGGMGGMGIGGGAGGSRQFEEECSNIVRLCLSRTDQCDMLLAKNRQLVEHVGDVERLYFQMRDQAAGESQRCKLLQQVVSHFAHHLQQATGQIPLLDPHTMAALRSSVPNLFNSMGVIVPQASNGPTANNNNNNGNGNPTNLTNPTTGNICVGGGGGGMAGSLPSVLQHNSGDMNKPSSAPGSAGSGGTNGMPTNLNQLFNSGRLNGMDPAGLLAAAGPGIRMMGVGVGGGLAMPSSPQQQFAMSQQEQMAILQAQQQHIMMLQQMQQNTAAAAAAAAAMHHSNAVANFASGSDMASGLFPAPTSVDSGSSDRLDGAIRDGSGNDAAFALKVEAATS